MSSQAPTQTRRSTRKRKGTSGARAGRGGSKVACAQPEDEQVWYHGKASGLHLLAARPDPGGGGGGRRRDTAVKEMQLAEGGIRKGHGGEQYAWNLLNQVKMNIQRIAASSSLLVLSGGRSGREEDVRRGSGGGLPKDLADAEVKPPRRASQRCSWSLRKVLWRPSSTRRDVTVVIIATVTHIHPGPRPRDWERVVGSRAERSQSGGRGCGSDPIHVGPTIRFADSLIRDYPAGFLREVGRLLRPGGRVILVEPDLWQFSMDIALPCRPHLQRSCHGKEATITTAKAKETRALSAEESREEAEKPV
ncbi:hypothetical protein DFH07DRAFT_768860 [Mycena maculata]|uniref:Uncharacterized protein n=1 Tax=Mycena maculata TaxID=230809 RepID=A0AAD7JQX2_9AGAR|nr:hypothetical protein DFH07DRAFT_768860 [Mycena maculata]